MVFTLKHYRIKIKLSPNLAIFILVNFADSSLPCLDLTRGSAIAEEPRDALRQLKYYGRFLTELLAKSSANPEEPCEHTVS